MRGLSYYKQNDPEKFKQDMLKAKELGSPGVIGDFAAQSLEKEAEIVPANTILFNDKAK